MKFLFCILRNSSEVKLEHWGQMGSNVEYHVLMQLLTPDCQKIDLKVTWGHQRSKAWKKIKFLCIIKGHNKLLEVKNLKMNPDVWLKNCSKFKAGLILCSVSVPIRAKKLSRRKKTRQIRSKFHVFPNSEKFYLNFGCLLLFTSSNFDDILMGSFTCYIFNF